MPKVLTIAWREFLATALTKGFLLGLLIPPVLIGLVVVLMPLLMNVKPPAVAGHIAVIDHSGTVATLLEEAFSKEKLEERRKERIAQATKQGSEAIGLDPKAVPDPTNAPGVGAQAAVSLPALPDLRVVVLPKDADLEQAKEPVRSATGRETAGEGGDARLALVVIPADAVSLREEAATGEDAFAKYELYFAQRLDPEVQGDIREQADRAILDARLAGAGLDVDKVRTLTQRPQSERKSVTREGERKTSEAAAILIPGAFMFLLWISVFTAGQYLLAGTIEEKGNRVMEVLLSAASPMELMVGKILGKGALGACVLLLYSGAGLAAMTAFAMTHLVAWHTLAWVLAFFLVAYLTIASLFAAVGAAVTDVTEAQSLLGPIMMILIIPMMLWLPILRNPNSTFAEVCSFVPLINPFVMVLRICGSEPIPFWQIPASLAVGLATVYIIMRLCAKIFRIGVLMYGKPPNLRTLVRWVKMA